MDWTEFEDAEKRAMEANEEEEALNALSEAWDRLLDMVYAIQALDVDDGTAKSQKAVKKALWKRKLLRGALEDFDKQRKVQMKAWSLGGVSHGEPQGRILTRRVPHTTSPTEEDLIEYYGLPEELLDVVLGRVQDVCCGLKGRPMAHLDHKLLMTLYWMRNNPTLSMLGRTFGVKKSCAWKNLRKMLAYLRVATDSWIPKSKKWRTNPAIQKIVNHHGESVLALGNLDGTAMYRRIKHPEGILFFRGDRGRAALTTQIISGFDDMVLDVVVCYGINSDGGVLNFSATKEKLKKHGLAVLVDSGYEADTLLVPPESGPHKGTAKTSFNTAHGHARSGVERVNAWVKNWRVVSACRTSVAMQSTAIVIACALYNLWRERFPLKTSVWHDSGLVNPLVNVGPQWVRGMSREDCNELRKRREKLRKEFETAKSDLRRDVRVKEGERVPSDE